MFTSHTFPNMYQNRTLDVPTVYRNCSAYVPKLHRQNCHVPNATSFVLKLTCTEIVPPFVPKVSCTDMDPTQCQYSLLMVCVCTKCLFCCSHACMLSSPSNCAVCCAVVRSVFSDTRSDGGKRRGRRRLTASAAVVGVVSADTAVGGSL